MAIIYQRMFQGFAQVDHQGNALQSITHATPIPIYPPGLLAEALFPLVDPTNPTARWRDLLIANGVKYRPGRAGTRYVLTRVKGTWNAIMCDAYLMQTALNQVNNLIASGVAPNHPTFNPLVNKVDAAERWTASISLLPRVRDTITQRLNALGLPLVSAPGATIGTFPPYLARAGFDEAEAEGIVA